MPNNVKNFRWVRLACGLALSIVLLSGCPSSDGRSQTWKIYRNPRYNFEFPYPSNWVPSRVPDNRDGQAFSDPTLPDVEIRGWAGYSLLENEITNHKATPPKSPQPWKQNFTTKQGLTGELQVDVRVDISLMTLTLKHESLLYRWQGRSPSKQFADYYRFFYYIASQYRVPSASAIREQGITTKE